MPKLPQPNYPQGEYPYLSPNPNSHEIVVDGGRGTPVIVNTEPKFQIDTTEESEEIAVKVGELKTYTDTELAKKENLANKVNEINGNSTTEYPSEKAVKEYVDTHKPEAISYLTTAPTSANTNGLKFVVLDSEPATYYDGYYYIITEANE